LMRHGRKAFQEAHRRAARVKFRFHRYCPRRLLGPVVCPAA
jgi:hypothetical protein